MVRNYLGKAERGWVSEDTMIAVGLQVNQYNITIAPTCLFVFWTFAETTASLLSFQPTVAKNYSR